MTVIRFPVKNKRHASGPVEELVTERRWEVLAAFHQYPDDRECAFQLGVASSAFEEARKRLGLARIRTRRRPPTTGYRNYKRKPKQLNR